MHLSRWLVPVTAVVYAAACNGKVDAIASTTDAGDAGLAADAAASSDAAPADAASEWRVDVADYDRSCQDNGDCLVVVQGPCRECMCPDVAISEHDVSRYIDDFSAERERTQCFVDRALTCDACNDVVVIGLCVDGACTTGTHRELDPDAYDRSCTTADDCVGVSPSLCSGGPGCSAAINRAAKEQFEADRAAAPACGTPGPFDESDCRALRDITCEDGTCEVEYWPVP